MENKEILTNFANIFVAKDFRSRFVHEAIKKPRDLHSRICHEINKVFDEKYKNKKTALKDNDMCLFLGWSGPLQAVTWKEAKDIISNGGGGYLVININGRCFYAETEAYPAVQYVGNS